MANVAEIVRKDSEESGNRWDAAVDGAERDGDAAQANRWAALGEKCSERYDAAIAAVEAGDLATAEAELERANELESEAGDNCDAHHALSAVRAAMSEVTP